MDLSVRFYLSYIVRVHIVVDQWRRRATISDGVTPSWITVQKMVQGCHPEKKWKSYNYASWRVLSIFNSCMVWLKLTVFGVKNVQFTKNTISEKHDEVIPQLQKCGVDPISHVSWHVKHLVVFSKLCTSFILILTESRW